MGLEPPRIGFPRGILHHSPSCIWIHLSLFGSEQNKLGNARNVESSSDRVARGRLPWHRRPGHRRAIFLKGTLVAIAGDEDDLRAWEQTRSL